MFGRGREVDELQAKIDAMEQQIAELAGATAAARPLLEDARRLEELAERAARSRQDTEATLDGLQRAVAATGLRKPRARLPLNAVHRADVLGYVSLYYNAGFTDDIQLLVGDEDPPTEIACEANTRNDINSYAGAIVRPGEYWMVQSKKGDQSGFVCVFTPLF